MAAKASKKQGEKSGSKLHQSWVEEAFTTHWREREVADKRRREKPKKR